ncbi:hypothetical protein SK128_011602 [Halocaridina rubra]|uniref:diacylglycerol kinase (ATP) n=1 Tax=Halocaridina rubra TaxID=373956 RepID=A0AAN8ZQA5_HALRR
MENEPLVAVLPLGTGNDLSRVLGFGEGHNADVDVEEYLDQVSSAFPAKLDRWKVCYTPCRSLGMHMPTREVFMNNYLSIGVDALVTLNFHRARQSPFYIFSNRLINKKAPQPFNFFLLILVQFLKFYSGQLILVSSTNASTSSSSTSEPMDVSRNEISSTTTVSSSGSFSNPLKFLGSTQSGHNILQEYFSVPNETSLQALSISFKQWRILTWAFQKSLRVSCVRGHLKASCKFLSCVS